MIMDDVLKAMLGDREAQQRLTEKGELIFARNAVLVQDLRF